MIIEFLYPEIADLYGEHGSFMLLRQIFHDAQIVETQQEARPYFADHEVDILFLGPSSERHQRLIIEKLMPHKERLRECIARGTHVLFIGNALEILGEYIETDKGERLTCLGLYAFHTQQNFKTRLNSEYMGELLGKWQSPYPLIGFKTQFTQCYGLDPALAWLKNVRGVGMNREFAFEGLVDQNLLATYLLGPFLILNPYFLRAWLDDMGQSQRAIPFFEDMLAAYQRRCSELLNHKTYLA